MGGTKNRCGFVPDSNEVADLGPLCCWRPVWRDHHRCIWHASLVEKPRESLVSHQPTAGERLDGATLTGVNLSGTSIFEECTLVGADFTGATCVETDFSAADLRWARFDGCTLVGAAYRHANLEATTFTRADLRDADFRQSRLSRTVFANAHVSSKTRFDTELVSERRMGTATSSERKTELGEAAISTYRRLERLFSEHTVSRGHSYYIRAHDVRRRLAWLNDEYVRALKLEGSRFVMLYGVSPWRVLAVSALLVVVSALLYPLTGGIQETAGETTLTYFIKEPTSPAPAYLTTVYVKSLYFSVVTFATLGYGDIQPVGIWARLIASIETILGSLLLAIMVFVLTRTID